MVSDRGNGGYRGVVLAVAGLVLLILGLAVGWSLQPRQPELTSNASYQTIAADYKPGGRNCEPSRLKELPSDRERAKHTETCQEAAEQHRLTSNDLIQQRRAADAANAMAILTYEQTGIAAWGMALGFVTMGAAIAAAFYARSAAVHSNQAHKSFVQAERAILRVVSAQAMTVTGGKGSDEVVGIVFKNVGRTSARVTLVGSRVENHAPRWTDIPAGEEVAVPGFAPPSDRSSVLDGWFWIEYTTIGGGTGTANFRLTAAWRPDSGYIAGRWICEVFNTNGHPDDT